MDRSENRAARSHFSYFEINKHASRITLFPYTTLFRSLGCQTVLLKGVNDDPEVMKLLMQRLLAARVRPRSEEHTSELQSHSDLVCRLLLEKKKRREDGPLRSFWPVCARARRRDLGRRP